MKQLRRRFQYRPDMMRGNGHLPVMATAYLLVLSMGASACAQRINVLGPPSAQSVTLVKVELANLPTEVFVEVKGPTDEDFRALDLFKPGDTAIQGDSFEKTPQGSGVLLFPVFLAGGKAIETARHPFRSAGHYWLRIRSSEIVDGHSPEQTATLCETEVEFADPKAADLEYFTLTRDSRIASLVGIRDSDLTGGARRNVAGLALMAHIVESTRHEGDPTHGRSEWADPLYELTFAVPDSSYAPYVAYYAACSYMWQRKNSFVKTQYGFDLPNRRLAELEYYQRARKALELAVERGDAYIRPFAMSFLAALSAWAGDFGQARTLIQSVEAQTKNAHHVARMAGEVKRFVEQHEHRD